MNTKKVNLFASAAMAAMSGFAAPVEKPNVVVIYVDDLGYADLGCYGAKGVETPHIDKMAENGMRFTDAHCSAATSSPSRYALLTGSYAFRNNAEILSGDAPLLIDTEMPTLPSMLQEEGYKTAVVGKWHLGLGRGDVDWNKSVEPGPLEIGFDYSFLIPATGDRVPCVYLEDHHVVNLDPDDPLYVRFDEKIGNDPTGLENPEMLRQMADEQHAKTIVNGISRIGYMKGGNSARWKDEDFPHIMLKKAREFIKKNQDDPFFLYFSFHDIHVPRLPDYRFIGQSEMGPRGDAIVQMDWTTGQLVKTFEEMGLDKNTLIIFSSDNGPVLDDGYVDYAVEMIGDHDPSGGFRGGKYSAYEAGTRVPTIAYWPSVIEPGESDALFSQVDLFASVAELVGHELSSDAAPDSYNMLEEIMGESNKGREFMVEESFTLALRKGQWKYIEPSDGPHFFDTKGIESGMYPYPQLFDLADDVAETTNLAEENPEITRELSEKLREIKKAIGTREGFKGK